MPDGEMPCYGGGACGWFPVDEIKSEEKKSESIDYLNLDYTKLKPVYARKEKWMETARFVKC